MIFPTAFILTLFLTGTQVAGLAAAQPEPDSEERRAQYLAVYNNIYDNPSRSLEGLACANLITIYPQLDTVPGFPLIGGAPNTSYGSPNCGACWKVTNLENNLSIHFTSIDDTDADPPEINLSLEAFNKLKGSTVIGSFAANIETADSLYCKN